MSIKLNALFSDSYVDTSQYRDQHFKVSIVFPSDKDASNILTLAPFVFSHYISGIYFSLDYTNLTVYLIQILKLNKCVEINNVPCRMYL